MNIQPTESSLTWHLLNALTVGNEITELMAAASDDGIGVIAQWKRAPNGSWTVEAMDTEGGGDWSPISEEETGIPPEPPFEIGVRVTDTVRLEKAESALRELVRLKDLKTRIERGDADDLNQIAALELEYDIAKPIAWGAARVAIKEENDKPHPVGRGGASNANQSL